MRDFRREGKGKSNGGGDAGLFNSCARATRSGSSVWLAGLSGLSGSSG